jgi:hypothetical protein
MPNKQLHLFDDHGDPVINLRKRLPSKVRVGEKTVENVLPKQFSSVLQWLKSNPEKKAILILRDPYARCISAINHLAYSGRIEPYKDLSTFYENVDPCVLNEVFEFSNYPRIIKGIEYYQVRRQVCVLSFEEDIIKNQELAIQTIFKFLGCDVDMSYTKLTTARKNKKVCKSICIINSKLLSFKKLRKLTQLANDALRLNPYKIEQDIDGEEMIKMKLRTLDWNSYKWCEVFENKWDFDLIKCL